MSDIELTEEQRAVVEEALEWAKMGGDEFAIGGLAGTGKTTIARWIVGKIPEMNVVAPTGKAADVLRSKGMSRANTIHSLIYDCVGEVADKRTGLARPIFERKHEDDLFDAHKIVLCDEASMVNDEMARDLRGLNFSILWVGDHGQLPPVGGDPGIMRDPDARLETIHRQAQGNPITRLAHMVRQGHDFKRLRPPDGDGRVRMLDKPSIPAIVDLCMADGVGQIMCAFNRTRQAVNAEYRRRLARTEPLHKGDRLMCLLNNRDYSVFNGQFFTVEDVRPGETDTRAEVDIVGDDGRRRVGVSLWLPCLGRGMAMGDPKNTCMFDYGWACTVHKMQGSSVRTAALIDEYCKQWDMARWRYTGVTRAEENIIVFR